MAARTVKIRHDDETRAKIQSAYLINRLTDYIAGKVKLEAGQVTAALGLLRKTTPDLQSVENKNDVTVTYVARMPARVADMDEWKSRYGLNQQNLQ